MSRLVNQSVNRFVHQSVSRFVNQSGIPYLKVTKTALMKEMNAEIDRLRRGGRRERSTVQGHRENSKRDTFFESTNITQTGVHYTNTVSLHLRPPTVCKQFISKF